MSPQEDERARNKHSHPRARATIVAPLNGSQQFASSALQVVALCVCVCVCSRASSDVKRERFVVVVVVLARLCEAIIWRLCSHRRRRRAAHRQLRASRAQCQRAHNNAKAQIKIECRHFTNSLTQVVDNRARVGKHAALSNETQERAGGNQITFRVRRLLTRVALASDMRPFGYKLFSPTSLPPIACMQNQEKRLHPRARSPTTSAIYDELDARLLRARARGH